MKSRILPFFLILTCLVAYLSLPICAQPAVSAQAAVLLECSAGNSKTNIVYERAGDIRLPMASTTKIMTALVAIESGNLDHSHAIPAEAVGVEGSSIYLTEGEHLTMEELLYALMLESANDAATAIACIVGGSVDGFACLMNDKAAALGLENTHFTNPHGLDDPDHYTTALDLAKLTSYALQNTTFAQIVSTSKTTIPLKDGEGTRVLFNHNRLLRQYDDVIGVKTGFTRHSGRCLVSAAEQNGVRLVAVTLNAPNDWQDHRSLLDLGFSQYETVTLANPGEFIAELPCVGTESGVFSATNKDALSIVLPVGTEVTHSIESYGLRFPPIQAGDTVGQIRFFADGEQIAVLPLVASESVSLPEKESGPLRHFFEKILDW